MNRTAAESTTDQLTKAFIADAIGEYLNRNSTHLLGNYRDGQRIADRLRVHGRRVQRGQPGRHPAGRRVCGLRRRDPGDRIMTVNPRLRAAVPSLLFATATAACVYAISAAINAPHLWPGTVVAFVWVTAVDYALSARRRRAAYRRQDALRRDMDRATGRAENADHTD